MTRIAALQVAPTDGSPIHLGYQSAEVYVPGTRQTVYFHYVFNPPHGDACLQLLLRGAVFKGYIWGTATRWSPGGRYLVASWTGPIDSQLGRTLVVVDLIQWRYVEAAGFRVDAIDEQGVFGNDLGGNAASILFEQQNAWNAA